MNDRILHKLDFARKLLLTAAAFLAIAVPITFGLLHATPGRAQEQAANSNVPATVFSSVSVKPSQPIADGLHKMRFNLGDGSFVAEGATLQHLIQMAYRLEDAQISGPSDLLTKPKFGIDAKLDPASVAATSQHSPGKMPFDDQAMLRSLLANQFKLVAHFETRNLPVYDLLVDENGSKLQQTNGIQMMHMERGELNSTGAPMVFLAHQLSNRVGSMVVDKTGLKGNYAFDLHWTPDPEEEERLARAGEPGGPLTTVRVVNPGPVAAEKLQAEKMQAEQATMNHQSDPNAPSLFVALQQQLGLKLEPQTEPVQVLVIDHVELPSAN